MKIDEQRRLTFGKYVWKTVEYVILTDLGYIEWCIKNVEGFELNEEEKMLYDIERKDNIRKRTIERSIREMKREQRKYLEDW